MAHSNENCTHDNTESFTMGGVTFTRGIVCKDCGKILEENGKKKEMSFKFGDVIENVWLSEDDPTRIGIYVRKLAEGYELTNGKGRFWTLSSDIQKIRVLGNALKK